MSAVVTRLHKSGDKVLWRVKCSFCTKSVTLGVDADKRTPYLAALDAGWNLLGPMGDWAAARCPACSRSFHD